jgi:hypothetical protein
MNVNLGAFTAMQNNVKMASVLLSARNQSPRMDDHEPHQDRPHMARLNNATSNCCSKLA